MSLLDDAKSLPKKQSSKTYTEEDFELTFAWLKDEITMTQAAKVVNKKASTGNVLYYFASVLKQAYQKGRLETK